MEQRPVPEGGGDGGDAARGGGGGDAGGGDGGNGLPLKPSPGAAVRPSQTRRATECDISRMPDSPPRRSPGHRRAHSDVIGGLPDDIIDDLAAPGDGPPSLSSDENEEELIFSMFLNVDDKLTNKNSAPDGAASSESGSSSCAVTTGGGGGEAAPGRAGVEPHSHSMDASSSVSTEHLFGTPAMEGTSSSSQQAKKALSAAKLAELALIDPKKAKRIINNRQSAARSKERKMRYISELERKVQFMQREATALATQLALLQRDTAGLSAENSELKIRLQNTEHQVRLQDALNDALKSELQRLKAATGQVGTTGAGGGMMMTTMNFGGGPPPFIVGANRPPTMFHGNHQQAVPPPFQLAMHQQQLGPNPPLLHPLLQAQQLQQQAAALGALNNMRGPSAAAAPLAPAPPGVVSWGEAWSESSSG